MKEAVPSKKDESCGVGEIEISEYRSLKSKTIEYDSKNHDYVIVIPCDGDKGWCELADTSALIYKYAVCESLGVKVAIHDDNDGYFLQYRLGMVRTRGYDTIRKRVKKAGLYASEKISGKALFLKLNKKFTEAEIDEFEKRELEYRAGINSIVKVDFIDPLVYVKMVTLGSRLHKICLSRMDKLSSVTIGKRIVEIIDDMLRIYYDMVGDLDEMEGWKKLDKKCNELLTEIQIVASIGLWNRERCASVGEQVLEIQKIIKRKIDETNRPKRNNTHDAHTGTTSVASGGASKSISGSKKRQAQN